MGVLWQALPPVKTVPVQNAQFVNIGVIKSGDIFNYKSSDAVNAFGTIERFGTGVVMFDKRYFTTTNWVKITVQPKTTPTKTTSKPKIPPGSITQGGFLSRLWRDIVLQFFLLFARFFAVVSWIVTKAITAVVKGVELIAKAVWDGLQNASKLGRWFWYVAILAFFLLFPSTAFAILRGLGDLVTKLIGRKSASDKRTDVR